MIVAEARLRIYLWGLSRVAPSNDVAGRIWSGFVRVGVCFLCMLNSKPTAGLVAFHVLGGSAGRVRLAWCHVCVCFLRGRGSKLTFRPSCMSNAVVSDSVGRLRLGVVSVVVCFLCGTDRTLRAKSTCGIFVAFRALERFCRKGSVGFGSCQKSLSA